MDNEMIKMLITQMANTPGWDILKAQLNRRITDATERLITVPPEELTRICAYQTVIRNCKEILNFVVINTVNN